MVRADSHRVLRALWYLRTDQELHPLIYRTITFYGCPFQGPLTRDQFVTPRLVLDQVRPALQPPHSIGSKTTKLKEFGLLPVRSPLLGVSISFSSPRGTEMFHFPRLPSIVYVFNYGFSGFT